MKGHHNLEVWKRAIKFVTEIYKMTDNFPNNEIYGLSQQMRRSAVSIPSNVAEGAGRNSTREFLQFLSISQGSLSELETQLIIGNNLGYIRNVEITLKELDEISKMLIGLSKSLKRKKGQQDD